MSASSELTGDILTIDKSKYLTLNYGKIGEEYALTIEKDGMFTFYIDCIALIISFIEYFNIICQQFQVNFLIYFYMEDVQFILYLYFQWFLH